MPTAAAVAVARGRAVGRHRQPLVRDLAPLGESRAGDVEPASCAGKVLGAGRPLAGRFAALLVLERGDIVVAERQGREGVSAGRAHRVVAGRRQKADVRADERLLQA